MHRISSVNDEVMRMIEKKLTFGWKIALVDERQQHEHIVRADDGVEDVRCAAPPLAESTGRHPGPKIGQGTGWQP